MSLLRCVPRSASVAAAMMLLAIAPSLAAAQDSVAAVWVPRQVRFIYRGFTTHYSCDGLRDHITRMLNKLGAQELNVRRFSCGVPTGPGVRVTMRVLVPASSPDAAKAKDPGASVQAHWQKVVLLRGNASPRDQSNCELIRQFRETFLPLFTTRDVDYRSNCVPRQVTPGTRLSAEVLMPANDKANSAAG